MQRDGRNLTGAAPLGIARQSDDYGAAARDEFHGDDAT